jgi:putative ATP-binding cassette transporter
MVAKPYWQGDRKRVAWSVMVGLIVLMLVDTQCAVWINEAGGELTSALAARDKDRFWQAVQGLLWVLALAVPAYAAYYASRDAYANDWRRWLTRRFLDRYLGDRNYFRLDQVDNPDQRISEDVNAFTGRSLNFLLILLGSVMQLIAFSAVLWSLSRELVGFLVVYAVAGTAMSMLLFGRPLLRLNFWQIKREADFRFRLMRVRENAESIAFYRGEKQERHQLDQRLRAALLNTKRLIRAQFFLNLFQRGFSQISLLLPYVVLAGAVMEGHLEVGQAVQAAGAFTAVLSAVSLIVDNFDSLSRFVAGIDRLYEMEQAMNVPPEPGGIERARGAAFELQGLTVQAPRSGNVLVSNLSLSLPPGESLLITGASGCGKSSLLRAIAGLWNSGAGHIHHPPQEDVFFLPQRPYLQRGTLRSQLIYPRTQSPVDDDTLQKVLDEVQLGHLARCEGGLDRVDDWEKCLSGGEQQRLAFARVLVQSPKVAVLDEATSALDDANQQRLYERLLARGVTLISIAHRAAVARFHRRVLRLTGSGRWELRPFSASVMHENPVPSASTSASISSIAPSPATAPVDKAVGV